MAIGSYQTQWPKIYPSLVLWLDANDPAGNKSQPADNSTIATWVDKSGLGNSPTQATGSNQPTYKLNIQGGKPILRFDGNDSLLKASPALMKGVGGCTMFTVVKYSSTAALSNVCSVSINGSNTNSRSFTGGSSGAYAMIGRRTDADASQTVSGGTIGTSLFFAQTAVFDYTNASAYLYVNGSLINSSNSFLTAGSTSNTVPNYLSVGAAFGTINPFFGDIAEIIIFQSALSASQRASIEQYLSIKWGIAL